MRAWLLITASVRTQRTETIRLSRLAGVFFICKALANQRCWRVRTDRSAVNGMRASPRP
jgi:hypothetical protein